MNKECTVTREATRLLSPEARRERAADMNMKRWADWFMPGTDVDGWFFGWCPVHDKEQKPDRATAQYNFGQGVMRCLITPESCHEGKKKGMTLVNVLWRLLSNAKAQ